MQLRNIAPGQPQATDGFREAASYSTPEELNQGNGRWAAIGRLRWLEAALFLCFAVFAACAPLATKIAVTAFRAALLVWLAKILIDGRKLHRQPLALPLLLFLLLTGASTVFSTEPLLSWGRMRGITELTIAILVGQSLKSLRQIKILVGLLLAGCLSSVAITAWQYTVGIGVKLVANDPASISLSQLGLLAGDIIQKINHRTVHSPRHLFTSLDALAPDSSVELTVARQAQLANQNEWKGITLAHLTVRIGRKNTLEEALRQPGVALRRGRPLRAEGTLKHYFPYSEVMVLIGLVVWGLLVAPGAAGLAMKLPLSLAFLSIALVVVLTLTRISLASLLLGCVLVTWKEVTRKTRRWFLLAFAVTLLLSMSWVQKQRAQKWVDLNDPGTQYRLLMWRDSIKFIRAHPLLGVGLDSIVGHWQRWDLEAYRRSSLKSHFHSTPIQFAVECGLPALAVWLWLMGGYLVFLLRLWTSSRERGWFPHGLASGILGGLLAVLLTSLLQYNFGDAEAMIVFWFLMGLAFALERIVLHDGVVS
jgi:O-antigen ligase